MGKKKYVRIPKGMLESSGNFYTDALGNKIEIQNVNEDIYYQNRVKTGRDNGESEGYRCFFKNFNEYVGWKHFNDISR